MKKTCTRCREEKPADMFSKFKRSRDGLHAFCKECNKECSRKTRLKDGQKEKERLRAIEYRKNNPDKAKDADLKYRKNNRAKARKATRSWQLRNPIANAIAASKRRARKRCATPAWLTDEHHEQIKELHEVARMFRLYTGVEYHVDHIVPLGGKSVCGLHVPWNMTVLVGVENQRKKNRYWPGMPGDQSQERNPS